MKSDNCSTNIHVALRVTLMAGLMFFHLNVGVNIFQLTLKVKSVIFHQALKVKPVILFMLSFLINIHRDLDETMGCYF